MIEIVNRRQCKSRAPSMRGEVPAITRSGHALSRCKEHEMERGEIAILRVGEMGTL